MYVLAGLAIVDDAVCVNRDNDNLTRASKAKWLGGMPYSEVLSLAFDYYCELADKTGNPEVRAKLIELLNKSPFESAFEDKLVKKRERVMAMRSRLGLGSLPDNDPLALPEDSYSRVPMPNLKHVKVGV